MGLKQYGNRTIGKREFKLSRLLVVLALILIPTVFFLLYFAYKDQFNFSFVPALENSIFMRWATPISFTIGWIFMILLFANRISDTIDKVDASFRVIPRRYKIYYGITAMVVFLGIVVPFITPIICILAFASFGFRISTIGHDWDEQEKVPKITYIVMAIFAVFPIFLAIATYQDIYFLSIAIFDYYQTNYLEILYRISMSLATALTIGSLIILVKLGVSEYEQAEIKAEREDIRIGWVRVVEFFLFALFITIEILEYIYDIQSLRILMLVIYWIGLGIVLFVTIVNITRGRSQPEFRRYLIGYILTVILMGLNLVTLYFTGNPTLQKAIQNWSIIISALIYNIVFFLMFFFGASED
ncbi:MAG: hypothetical protein JW776_00125 [Candidatus Lokiarchaeota archaeon]|nr:hypothetical protein [Candidatus Lokiarchaeota archaeon]